MNTAVRHDRVDFGHRTIVVRRSAFALRWPVRSMAVCAVLAVLTAGLAVWALTLGDFPLTPARVWEALTDPDAGFARRVVVEWRLPRVLAAVVFGAALGASGAMFQSLTRNPLASPDIIGFTAGSYTGALVVIILIGGGGYLMVAAGALLGGVATAAAVYLFAWRRGVQGFRLIVVGIAISAMLGSFNTWLRLIADLEVAMRAAAWGAGSLSSVLTEQLVLGGAVIAVLLVLTAVLAPQLRQLELGDDAAKATGIRAEPVRAAVVMTGVALVATVTAAAGPIAFVALAAPQIARRIARTPGVTIAPAAFTGALLLLAADLVSQHALPFDLPVGVVTVVVGGGYLVWLLVREVRGRV